MDIYELMDNRWAQLTVVGLTTFAAGFGVGHYVGKSKDIVVLAETDELVEEVTVDDHPQLDFGQEMSHAHPTIGLVVDEEYTKTETLRLITQEPEEEPEITNIFASSSDWDMEKELASRTKDKPHMIHQDEFFSEESGYVQSQCTYYVGDDILVDDREVPIAKHKTIVGEFIFGHGTPDKNVVYVRNDVLQGEYEILKHEGFYSIEVLGYDQESQVDEEAAKPNVRKFREE